MKELANVVRDYVILSRSKYQLQHFVIGQHDTPEMRYRQILIEAKELLHNIKHAELQLEIDKKRIEKLEKTGDEIKHLKAAQIKLGASVLQDSLEAAKRELSYLVEMSKDYRYYSPDDIEANQADYWAKRLTRQADTDRMALQQGIDKGNLASLMQAGLTKRELTV